MNAQEISEERRLAMRSALRDLVAGQRGWAKPWHVGVAFGAGLVLAAGSVSAAAWAIQQAGPSHEIVGTGGSDGIAAPDGVLPGTVLVTIVGDAKIERIEGSATVVAEVPENASHVRVTVVCESEGTWEWGLEDQGTTTTACTADNVGSNGYFDLDAVGSTANVVFITEPNSKAVVTIQPILRIETAWGVNESGQTFGVTKDGAGDPDLLAVVGIAPDGGLVDGYVYSTDLNGPTPTGLVTDDQGHGDREIPVYLSDGKTRVGVFTISNS